MTTLPGKDEQSKTVLEALKQHMEPDDNGLRGCPFCKDGGSPTIFYAQSYREPHPVTFHYACGCNSCGVTQDTSDSPDDDREYGVTQWNTRASDPLLLEYARRLEIAEKMLNKMRNDGGDPHGTAKEILRAITAPFEDRG